MHIARVPLIVGCLDRVRCLQVEECMALRKQRDQAKKQLEAMQAEFQSVDSRRTVAEVRPQGVCSSLSSHTRWCIRVALSPVTAVSASSSPPPPPPTFVCP